MFDKIAYNQLIKLLKNLENVFPFDCKIGRSHAVKNLKVYRISKGKSMKRSEWDSWNAANLLLKELNTMYFAGLTTNEFFNNLPIHIYEKYIEVDLICLS